tara:strand:- start:356 stop:850 length:495 start_codon:yes stop_codon:yes gene_type:complete
LLFKIKKLYIKKIILKFMHFISHRGNLNGPNSKFENSKEYIEKAIESGFEVEIDVWFIKNQFFLGHDEPAGKVNEKFLQNKSLWCHAKNLSAFENLLKIKAHCFWHQEDDFVLTNKGYIWTYPGKEIGANSIIVMPENIKKFKYTKCSGICSDFIAEYKEKYEK